MDAAPSLGEYVRRLRRRKRWGLQELADGTGLSVSHLSRIENDNAVPSADTVVRLAGALDGDLDQMLDMANCLPREIVERYVHRAGGGAAVLRRSARPEVADPTFARALVNEMDPDCRQTLARQFGLSDQDVEGLFRVLQGLAELSPGRRERILTLLAETLRGGDP